MPWELPVMMAAPPARLAHGVPAGAVAGGWMIAGSLGSGDSGVVSMVIQGASGSDARIACIRAASRAWYRPSARPSWQRPQPEQVSLAGQVARGLRLAGRGVVHRRVGCARRDG